MSKTPEQEFLESVDQRRGQAWSNDSSAICEVLREYASLQNAELIKVRDIALKEVVMLVTMLQEAALQIDYLHRKFKPTGSGKNVISRIESLIEKYTDKK